MPSGKGAVEVDFQGDLFPGLVVARVLTALFGEGPQGWAAVKQSCDGELRCTAGVIWPKPELVSLVS
ncbi:hypothetical protein HMPREF3121_07475 [Corynebacterium sp. HMSC11E11]|nr:hypothetical protein HMPREF3121_07475 [Corynebacterium sp. HMSC11E11]